MNTPSPSLPLRRRGLTYLAGATFAGAVALTALHAARSVPDHPPVSVQVDDHPVNRGALESASYAGVAKRIAPSVVKITVVARSRAQDIDPRQFQQMDPFFRQFFGQFGPGFGQGDQGEPQGRARRPQARQPEEEGLGSGVIISPDGYIVTNNHVVDGAKEVTVALHDGRELKAVVIGRDPQSDLAVVKVDAKDLPAITFAQSSQVEVGDRVLAVGNPFGIGETVTSGIVSMTDQRSPELGGLAAYEDYIQTDAAINPGNSGGALVDVDGRLIGINTAILTHSGGFQGVGLAIPSDMVRTVVNGLVQNGKVIRGYLGVSIQNLNPELAQNFNVPVQSGVLVTDVTPDTPAARAGLRSGDVITKVGDTSVADADQLKLVVSETPPDTQLKLQLLRDGKTETVTATTATLANRRLAGEPEEPSSSAASSSDDQGVLNGVAVGDLDSAARQQFDIRDPRVHGAVITDVSPDSASARAGLEAGDVILEINHHAVSNADEAVKLSADATKKKTLVKLWSHGGMIYTVVDETAQGNS